MKLQVHIVSIYSSNAVWVSHKGQKRDYAPKNGGSYGGRLWLAHPVFGEVQVERFKEKNKGQAIIYYQQQMGMKNLTANVTSANEKLFQEVLLSNKNN